MKAIEKIQLINKIAIDLQNRFSFRDTDMYLDEFKVNQREPGKSYSNNSVKIYVKDRLSGVSVSEIKRIADELDIDTQNLISAPPKNWEETTSVKAFISHTAKDKANAIKLRDMLKPHNIDSFVAHEDIKPSEEWQEEIRKALNTMDFFLSLHTKGFKESIWCQQEIGFAAARNVKMIPIKFDEDPNGFIAKIQALIRGSKTAEDVANEILDILKDDEMTRDIYIEKIFKGFDDLEGEIPF